MFCCVLYCVAIFLSKFVLCAQHLNTPKHMMYGYDPFCYLDMWGEHVEYCMCSNSMNIMNIPPAHKTFAKKKNEKKMIKKIFCLCQL